MDAGRIDELITMKLSFIFYFIVFFFCTSSSSRFSRNRSFLSSSSNYSSNYSSSSSSSSSSAAILRFPDTLEHLRVPAVLLLLRGRRIRQLISVRSGAAPKRKAQGLHPPKRPNRSSSYRFVPNDSAANSSAPSCASEESLKNLRNLSKITRSLKTRKNYTGRHWEIRRMPKNPNESGGKSSGSPQKFYEF